MSLIARNAFVGIEDVIHLSCGGEAPMLRSHQDAIDRFIQDKALGERAREEQAALVSSARAKCGLLFGVNAADIAFVSNASEGINIVAYGLNWQKGDNVVIADVEFASGIYPWLTLTERGVDVRVVRHKNWHISLEDIEDLVDDNTRVVLMSQVSMFTGQRISVETLADIAHQHNAALVLDATHAAGVVHVDAKHADVVVSSCYKWLLGVHGTAIFYWNRERMPELKVPFLGWNSAAVGGGWKNPLNLKLQEDASRFMPGNPGFISIYILDNALNTILSLGIDKIEQHALSLTDRLWHGIERLGWELMTPQAPMERAGNVCIMTDKVSEVSKALLDRHVLVWGTYGGDARLRISTHVYNDEDDVDMCLEALATVPINPGVPSTTA